LQLESLELLTIRGLLKGRLPVSLHRLQFPLDAQDILLVLLGHHHRILFLHLLNLHFEGTQNLLFVFFNLQVGTP
jgi:hypothetical protein